MKSLFYFSNKKKKAVGKLWHAIRGLRYKVDKMWKHLEYKGMKTD